MQILNNGRFGMGAAMSGVMKRCIKQAVEHANQRVQFNDKIRNYQLIREKIAEMVRPRAPSRVIFLDRIVRFRCFFSSYRVSLFILRFA